MTDASKAPHSKPETKTGDGAKPGKKHNSILDGYVLIILGALLFMIGGHYSNAPLGAQHRLLVATSEQGMKVFQKSVIFVAGHTRQGAYGFLINRPHDKSGVSPGGPVGEKDPEKIYALHSLDVTFPDTVELGDVGMGFLEGTKKVEELRGAKNKPSWYIILKGYAGWAPGQLEQEISQGGWTVTEFDHDTVTSTPPAKLWDATRKLAIVQLTH
jgi:putative transcriptional regulator